MPSTEHLVGGTITLTDSESDSEVEGSESETPLDSAATLHAPSVGNCRSNTARGKKANESVSDQKKKKKIKRTDTQILTSFDDPKYLSSDEELDDRVGGAKMTPVLLKVSKPVRAVKEQERLDEQTGIATAFMEKTGKKRVRCIASAACGRTWNWPRNRQRILSHAKECSWVPAELRRESRDVLAKLALGPASGDEGGPRSTSAARRHMAKRSRGRADSDSSTFGDDCEKSSSLAVEKPAKKKAKQAVRGTEQSKGTLDVFVASGRKEAAQTLKREADHRLLLYIVCNLIPPRTVDTLEFKAFAKRLNPNYDAPCSSTIRDKLIPAEAARLDIAIIEYLRGVRDLTLSFDGGKIRKPKGCYTVTLSTPKRDPFTMTLKDGSRVSHTAKWLVEITYPVCFIFILHSIEWPLTYSHFRSSNRRSHQRGEPTGPDVILTLFINVIFISSTPGVQRLKLQAR